MANQSSENAAWMHAPRLQAKPSPESGGLGRRVSEYDASDQGMHDLVLRGGGDHESLHKSAVLQLLRAFLRNDRGRVAELAAVIAAGRGNSQGHCASAAEGMEVPSMSLPPWPVAYENKLLAGIQRKVLLNSNAAASNQGEQPKLFSLCRQLCDNPKCFDPEFSRELRMPSIRSGPRREPGPTTPAGIARSNCTGMPTSGGSCGSLQPITPTYQRLKRQWPTT